MFAIDENDSISYGSIRLHENTFDSLDELVALANTYAWSKQRVTDIWNSFAGTAGFADLKPQKCFKNRPYGLQRLWDAIRRLVPASSPPVHLETLVDKSEALPVKAKERPAKAPKAKGKTKRDEVIRLISREKGASLAEIAEKMGYELHTVRGLISTLGSKHGLNIESTKSETKGRVYRLVA